MFHPLPVRVAILSKPSTSGGQPDGGVGVGTKDTTFQATVYPCPTTDGSGVSAVIVVSVSTGDGVGDGVGVGVGTTTL